MLGCDRSHTARLLNHAISIVLAQNLKTLQKDTYSASDQVKKLLSVMDDQYWGTQELMEQFSCHY